MTPLRLSANISMLFREVAFADRIAAAAAAGFAAVECQFPYDVPADVLARRLEDAGLPMIGLNTPPGETFGAAALPGQEARFRAEFGQALAYATALRVPAIHVMSGVTGGASEAARRSFVANLRWAADEAPGHTLLIEPLNTRDRPGYFVSRSDEVAERLAEVDRPNVKMMFDLYHVQMMEGDLTARIDRHFPLIGHVQIASVPGRHEPDLGEVAYERVFEALQARGWAGFIGAEYNPRGETLAGLGWARPWLRA
jgi:hydroxypyruvate isomerase